jgi:hypothetical protein
MLAIYPDYVLRTIQALRPSPAQHLLITFYDPKTNMMIERVRYDETTGWLYKSEYVRAGSKAILTTSRLVPQTEL